MWEDFKIGKGDHGNTSVTTARLSTELAIKDLKACVSENDVSYWASHCFLGASGIIMKDTWHGERMAILVEYENFDQIDDLLDRLVLENVSPRYLRDLIEHEKKQSFMAGGKAARKTMRKALGIHSLN